MRRSPSNAVRRTPAAQREASAGLAELALALFRPDEAAERTRAVPRTRGSARARASEPAGPGAQAWSLGLMLRRLGEARAEPILSPAEHYARLVRGFASRRGVTVGAGRGRGFGSSGLAVNARLFAMLSSCDAFVVKLPAARVDALVAEGAGRRFEAGRGRPLREWLELRPGNESRWHALALEALDHVGRAP